MQIIQLSPTDAKYNLATHKIVINAADVAALGSGTTGTLAIFPVSGTFPAGTTARFSGLNLKTPFDSSDADINSLTIQIGDGGDTDRLLTATQIHLDGTEVLFKVEGAVTQPYAYLIADTIDALFTVAGGASPTLAETTVGEVEIYLHLTSLRATENVRGPL